MNWGHGITIALVAFMSFIVYMGVILIKTPTELVSPDYYKNEVVYEREVTAQQNAINNESNLEIENTEEGLFLQINTIDEVKKAHIKLYRANAKDSDVNIASDGKSVFINKEKLTAGKYYLTVDWKVNDKNFQLRETVWIQ
ncbi:hypothetical protein CW751_03210 [Brumimicrobium salinarum]|uniref:Nitrogen fixation protein FixH n=1 Tax=Brumimicrobium salinarum TaxID=2058658 RepID=A0A2I0R4R2_9FLAO|nr:FixH family protein [Brumimicrobium salinarum]PKR81548.1 hypothetical protein CW751_03210 [Brumimicrobium salinarum]